MRLNTLFIALIMSLLWRSVSLGAEMKIDSTNTARDIKFIAGYLKEELRLDSSANKYESKQISQFAFLPVAQSYSSNGNSDTYEVMYCGKGYVVKQENIDISTDDKIYIESLNKEQIDIMAANASKASLYYRTLDFEKGIALRDRFKKKGLIIYDREIYDTSEYSEGTGFKVSIINTSNKIIKYISFAVIGYNPVNDMVRGTPIVRGVGPIKPWALSEYNWEYMWFTDLVQTHKIKQVKIQYMDGSIKIYSPVDDIILSGHEKYLMNVLGDPDTKEVFDIIDGNKNK